MGKVKNELESHLLKEYSFRRNIILDRTEFKLKKQSSYSLLTERDLNTIYRHAKAANVQYRLTLNGLKSLLNSDFVEELDPFKEYFNKLTPWDKTTDYIYRIASVVKTTNDIYWQECFKKWIVGVVACAVEPVHVNHQVLVLSGVQGLGKTYFLNSLLPSDLGGYLYSGIINPNNKDALVNLSENLFINLDELENLNKSELGSLKSLITQSEIRIRRAYGQFNENLIRRASFMGSVNDAEFLTDSSGNRRYLCFNALSIDRDHHHDINQMYAQAYALYKEGIDGKPFKWWFDKDDIKKVEENNESYLRVSLEEQLLTKYFSVPVGNDYRTMHPIEIIKFLEEKAGIKIMDHGSIRRLGQAMTKHGYRKKSVKNTKPYMVKVNDSSEKIESISNLADDSSLNAFDQQEQLILSMNELDFEYDNKRLKRSFDNGKFEGLSESDFDAWMTDRKKIRSKLKERKET